MATAKLVDNGDNDDGDVGNDNDEDEKRMEVDNEVAGEDNGDIATSPKEAQLPGQLVPSV